MLFPEQQGEYATFLHQTTRLITMTEFIQNIIRRPLFWPQLALPVLRQPEPTRFRLLPLFLVTYSLYAFVMRLALMARSWPQIDHAPLTIGGIFVIGLFYDLVSAGYFALPLVFYLVLMPRRFFASKYHRIPFYPLTFMVLYALGFSAMAEWLFWDEFGSRFNFIAVDYLVYTHEVIGNIRESYPVASLLTILGLVTCGIFMLLRPRLDALLFSESKTSPTVRLAGRAARGALALLVPLLSFWAVTGTATDIYSNRYEKELAASGPYQLFAAFRNNVLDYDAFYAGLDEKVVVNGLRGQLAGSSSTFVHQPPAGDIARLITAAGPEKQYNVVLIMEESMSAQFLGAFGNEQALTPNLDRLANEGLLFKRIYATGTRTVRGMEAVTMSVPPTPGRSTVKRPDNANMFSLGLLFKEKGYDTKFLYNGYGYFDNMNAFFSGNGFEIIDRGSLDKEEITFANVWGVCDEDIFRRAVKEFDRSHAQGKPFLGYVMTTSNHRPYTYPDGKIDIPSQTGRSGGVKYSDYALGEFINEAKLHPWFADTIFVVVADHCAGSAGYQELPVHQYHIPLIFYGPGIITPGVNRRLASQIDVVPTILGMLHWNYQSKFFGKDILGPDFTERAFIGNYQKLGYLKDDYLTILTERHDVHQYRLADETMQKSELIKAADRQDLEKEAIFYYQGASLMFTKRLNRWD